MWSRPSFTTRCGEDKISGQAQGIPWLIFYQAWSQAQGDERAILVPRLQRSGGCASLPTCSMCTHSRLPVPCWRGR